MNSAHTEAGKFSCAIDSFLEISYYVISLLIIGIEKSFFFQLLSNAVAQYDNLIRINSICFDGHTINLLNDIREPVWAYMRSTCNSFIQMDCNAQFSEIFQDRNFPFNDAEKSLLQIKFNHISYCKSCEDSINVTVEVFVHYITLKDLSDTKLNSSNWPELTTLFNCNPNSLQCDRCQTVSEILPTTCHSFKGIVH